MSDSSGWRTPKGRERKNKIPVRGRGWPGPTTRGGRGSAGRGRGAHILNSNPEDSTINK